MTDRSSVIAELKTILGDKYAIRKNVTEQTRLYHDLGLRGTDAADYLTAVFQKFEVDQSGFDFADYFKGEYFSPVDILNSMLGRKDRSKKPLTLAHLADVCVQQQWFSP